MHLGAAGLVRGEDNLVAQALKNFDGGACYAGVHAVNDARGEECNAHDLSVLSSVFRVSRSHRLASGAGGGTIRTSSVFQRSDSDVLSRGSWAGWFRLMCAPQVEVGCGGIRNRGDVFYLPSHLTPLCGFSLVEICTYFPVK